MSTTRWILNTPNKMKMALAMILLAALLLVVNMFEKKEMESMGESHLSIYADRLVPATSIFEMRESMYRKREVLKDMLYAESRNISDRQRVIDSCNQAIHRLLMDYKKTYFLKDEANYLQEFETGLQQYDLLETRIVYEINADNMPSAIQLYEQKAMPHFKMAVLKLSELNHIQSEIGKDMVSASNKAIASFLLLSELETALIVIFSFIAHILIHASRGIIRSKVEPFNLN